MTNVLRYAMVGLIAMAGICAGRSEASVVIGGTRVVYPSREKEVTVKLTNESERPALVQVWLDAGDERSTPDTAKVPFTVAPPIFRMEPGKGQALRVMYTKEPLPTDKETLFWINVLEVPPKAENTDGKNLLQFAFRTRIKMLFRPTELTGDVSTAPDKLRWKLIPGETGKGLALQVSNPTPYYVNFARVAIQAGGHDKGNQGGGMVAPGGSSTFPLKDVESRPSGDVTAAFSVISDYGAVKEMIAPLSP
jgi:chaperone protein EcpD